MRAYFRVEFYDAMLVSGLEKSGTQLNTLLDSLHIKVEESAESLVSQIDSLKIIKPI